MESGQRKSTLLHSSARSIRRRRDIFLDDHVAGTLGEAARAALRRETLGSCSSSSI